MKSSQALNVVTRFFVWRLHVLFPLLVNFEVIDNIESDAFTAKIFPSLEIYFFFIKEQPSGLVGCAGFVQDVNNG